MIEKIVPNSELPTVTLTTASGHKFTYSYNVRTIAAALAKLEQSQMYADKKAARDAATPLLAAVGAVEPTGESQNRTSAVNGQIDQ